MQQSYDTGLVQSVIPARYGIHMMKSKTPDTNDDTAIEAFFAHLGVEVEVIDRCPVAACRHCAVALDEAA